MKRSCLHCLGGQLHESRLFASFRGLVTRNDAVGIVWGLVMRPEAVGVVWGLSDIKQGCQPQLLQAELWER
jgi:hypothetical protein